jgi:dTDP-4-amino-4,6-dideoxygalactose transaminase
MKPLTALERDDVRRTARGTDTNCGGRTRVRVLPPVGAPVPYRAVARGLAACLNPAKTVERLAGVLARSFELRHWIFVSSGRAALSAALMALKEQRPGRDEVVVPAYTSYSVPAGVVRAGLRIRLCDIERETLGLAPDALESSINDRTLCVLADHLYGLPARMDVLCAIARSRGVPVIEDAAQAMGIRCRNKWGGATGDLGVFSASRGKTLPGAGGGLIGTNDDRLADACRRGVPRGGLGLWRDAGHALKSLIMASFLPPSRYWLPASLPFLKLGQSWYDPFFPIAGMSGFQAALLEQLFPSLNRIRDGRRGQAMRLRTLLEPEDLIVLWPRPGDEGAFLRLPVLVPDAGRQQRLLAEFRRRGLGVVGGYPQALSQLQEVRTALAGGEDGCPVAEEISQRIVTLPTHPWVDQSDYDAIRDVVRQCV